MTKEQISSINELRELARAIKAFIEQDSRSYRRQCAMVNGAEDVLENAQKAFGDET